MKDADALAIDILNWLAMEPDLLNRFIGISGIDVSQLRTAAQEPHFLQGVIGFLMGHEPTLMRYCEAHNQSPEQVIKAYEQLGGQIHY